MKTGSLIINYSLHPPLPYTHTVTERLFPQSEKIWKKGALKNPNFPSFRWIEKNLEVTPRLIFSYLNFSILWWIGKTWEVQLQKHPKIPFFNLYVNWEKNLEKQPLNIFEPNWESIKWIRKSYVLIKFYCWKWEVYTE